MRVTIRNIVIDTNTVAAAHSYDSSPTDFVAWLDDDSHADLHCAGSNMIKMKSTGYTCDVDPFLSEYDTTKNIEIVMAATAVQVSADLTVYLVMTQALWFGDRMKDSLMNSNLARDAGVDICTDPHDKHRKLGITANGIFLPMTRRGNSIGLKTFKPDPAAVAEAMRDRSNARVIYLNAEDEFMPGKGISEVGVAAPKKLIFQNDNSYKAMIAGMTPLLTQTEGKWLA